MKKSLLALAILCFVAIGYAIPQTANAQDPFIGEIRLFAGNFAPRGWAFCHGQLLQISQNTALFSILGTTYGGDGRTTFGLPDLRGRVPLGQGTGPGLATYSLGQKGGVERVTLTTNQLPSHTHTHNHDLMGSPNPASSTSPADKLPGTTSRTRLYSTSAGPSNVMMDTDAISDSGASVGSSQSHENRQPYLGLNYIIALVGLFPSPN